MPSREASLRNLEKARANGRPPRPLRSPQETRLIQQFVWQWHSLSDGPRCSGRALAKWLGVSHTYVQKLGRQISADPNKFFREARTFGLVTLDGLQRAREETRRQRERGWLRPPRRWKTVEYKIGDQVIRNLEPVNFKTPVLAAGDALPPFPPPQANPNPQSPNYTAIHMANLRMNAERDRIKRVYFLRGRRWRPRPTW